MTGMLPMGEPPTLWEQWRTFLTSLKGWLAIAAIMLIGWSAAIVAGVPVAPDMGTDAQAKVGTADHGSTSTFVKCSRNELCGCWVLTCQAAWISSTGHVLPIRGPRGTMSMVKLSNACVMRCEESETFVIH